MAFSSDVVINSATNEVLATLQGAIDENAELPTIAVTGSPVIRLNLKNISMINSMGCRRWVMWIAGLTKGVVELIECPPAVVNQASILNGFLPKNARIRSLFVPYFCEPCGHEDRLLVNVIDTMPAIQKQIPCPKCGEKMDLDVMPDRYFSFLKQS